MGEKRPYYSDAQAFLGFPGEPPRVEDGLQLDLALVTCAPPAGPCAESLGMTLTAIEQFKAELVRQEVRIVVRSWQADVEDGRLNVVLGLQNLPMYFDAESDREFVMLYNAGVRVIALAYDRTNKLGSGCLNIDGELSLYGKMAIQKMNNHGFILDLSHASHRTAREALEFIDKGNLSIPVMASHGGCYSVYPHFRNLPDDVLAGIAKRGGVVGIANLTFILHQNNNEADPFWEHVSHAIRVCGAESVVIGSDAPYTTYTAEQEREMFEKMKGLVDLRGTWASRYPMYTQQFAGPDKLEKMKYNFPAVTGILGENLLNFFKRSLPL